MELAPGFAVLAVVAVGLVVAPLVDEQMTSTGIDASIELGRWALVSSPWLLMTTCWSSSTCFLS